MSSVLAAVSVVVALLVTAEGADGFGGGGGGRLGSVDEDVVPPPLKDNLAVEDLTRLVQADWKCEDSLESYVAAAHVLFPRYTFDATTEAWRPAAYTYCRIVVLGSEDFSLDEALMSKFCLNLLAIRAQVERHAVEVR